MILPEILLFPLSKLSNSFVLDSSGLTINSFYSTPIFVCDYLQEYKLLVYLWLPADILVIIVFTPWSRFIGFFSGYWDSSIWYISMLEIIGDIGDANTPEFEWKFSSKSYY